MNKADSLERLAHWAQWGAPFADGSLNEMDDAVSHGAAAVQAVRLLESVPSLFGPSGYLSGATGEEIPREAVNEARLAFRAALNAVGIRGAL